MRGEGPVKCMFALVIPAQSAKKVIHIVGKRQSLTSASTGGKQRERDPAVQETHKYAPRATKEQVQFLAPDPAQSAPEQQGPSPL